MHGIESTNANRSNGGIGASAESSRKIGPADASPDSLGASAEDDANWFADTARRLLSNAKGEKAGFALYVTTGMRFDPSTCDRYAAGRIRPTAYFLRALLRTDCGWQFLCAAMEGSGVAWWAEIQRAKRIADAIDRER